MGSGLEIFAFVAVTLLALALSFGILALTRIPAVVVLCAAVLTALLYTGYARVMGAHWDTVALVTFVGVLVYAAVVSFAFIGVGRLVRWSTFVDVSEE